MFAVPALLAVACQGYVSAQEAGRDAFPCDLPQDVRWSVAGAAHRTVKWTTGASGVAFLNA